MSEQIPIHHQPGPEEAGSLSPSRRQRVRAWLGTVAASIRKRSVCGEIVIAPKNSHKRGRVVILPAQPQPPELVAKLTNAHRDRTEAEMEERYKGRGVRDRLSDRSFEANRDS